MFVSARVSIFVTYLLAGTRVSANQVTAVFTAVGLAAVACTFLPAWWGPVLGLVLYRIHVILDVVDGEVARLRETSSPRGAYLDYLTHYFVYTSVGLGLGANLWHRTGTTSDLIAGFGLAIGLMMNLASKDCWYRANYASAGDVEGRSAMWGAPAATLLLTRIMSINTVWTMYAAAVAATYGVQWVGVIVPRVIITFYGLAMPTFAVARAVVTARNGRIPRRSAWY